MGSLIEIIYNWWETFGTCPFWFHSPFLLQFHDLCQSLILLRPSNSIGSPFVLISSTHFFLKPSLFRPCANPHLDLVFWADFCWVHPKNRVGVEQTCANPNFWKIVLIKSPFAGKRSHGSFPDKVIQFHNSHEIPCMLVWLWFSHVFQVVCNVFHVFFQCFLFSYSDFPGSPRFPHIFPHVFPRFSPRFFRWPRTRRPPRRRTWPPSGGCRRRSSARRNCRGGEMGKELWFIK